MFTWFKLGNRSCSSAACAGPPGFPGGGTCAVATPPGNPNCRREPAPPNWMAGPTPLVSCIPAGSWIPGGRERPPAVLLEIVRLEGTIILPGSVDDIVAATEIGVAVMLSAGERLSWARSVEPPVTLVGIDCWLASGACNCCTRLDARILPAFPSGLLGLITGWDDIVVLQVVLIFSLSNTVVNDFFCPAKPPALMLLIDAVMDEFPMLDETFPPPRWTGRNEVLFWTRGWKVPPALFVPIICTAGSLFCCCCRELLVDCGRMGVAVVPLPSRMGMVCWAIMWGGRPGAWLANNLVMLLSGLIMEALLELFCWMGFFWIDRPPAVSVPEKN